MGDEYIYPRMMKICLFIYLQIGELSILFGKYEIEFENKSHWLNFSLITSYAISLITV